jgi:hypothetical protein
MNREVTGSSGGLYTLHDVWERPSSNNLPQTPHSAEAYGTGYVLFLKNIHGVMSQVPFMLLYVFWFLFVVGFFFTFRVFYLFTLTYVCSLFHYICLLLHLLNMVIYFSSLPPLISLHLKCYLRLSVLCSQRRRISLVYKNRFVS